MEPKTQKVVSICTVCVMIGVIFAGSLLVDEMLKARRDELGTLVVTVSKLETLIPEERRELSVVTGRSIQTISPFLTSLSYVRARFKNTTRTQDVLVAVNELKKRVAECEMVFTVEELATLGYLDVSRNYTLTNNCSLQMTVQWSVNKH